MIERAPTWWRKGAYVWPTVLCWLLAFVVVPNLTRFEPGHRALASFLLSLAGMISVFVACGWAVSRSALGILLNGRNVYSLSRLQMVLWTVLVFSALLATAACRGWNQVDALDISIPNNLLAAMGISFVSAAAAPALLSLKSQAQPSDDELAAASGVRGAISPSGKLVGRPPGAPAALSDLVKGDELANCASIDLSKVQQLIVTALLVVVYCTMLWNFFLLTDLGTSTTTLPDFNPSFVNLMLISHGGYLAYKAVSKPADTALGLQRPPPPDRNAGVP